MKKYELMTMYKSSLGEDGTTTVSNSIKDLISALSGKVLDSTALGKRKLAYTIKHEKDAYYDVMQFELDPSSVAKFRSKLNLTEGLLRYLITDLGRKHV